MISSNGKKPYSALFIIIAAGSWWWDAPTPFPKPQKYEHHRKKAHINLNNQQTGNHVNDLIIKSKSMIQSQSNVDILVKSENLGH